VTVRRGYDSVGVDGVTLSCCDVERCHRVSVCVKKVALLVAVTPTSAMVVKCCSTQYSPSRHLILKPTSSLFDDNIVGMVRQPRGTMVQ
jgi:hypothetical protein